MVILAGSGWGMLQAAKIEECYRQMRYLRKLIFRIRSEIRYSRQVLPEAFLSVGSEAQEPYKMWLLSLYLEQMEQKMEDMRTEQKEKIRLYQCIGVTGGVFLAIILL